MLRFSRENVPFVLFLQAAVSVYFYVYYEAMTKQIKICDTFYQRDYPFCFDLYIDLDIEAVEHQSCNKTPNNSPQTSFLTAF